MICMKDEVALSIARLPIDGDEYEVGERLGEVFVEINERVYEACVYSMQIQGELEIGKRDRK